MSIEAKVIAQTAKVAAKGPKQGLSNTPTDATSPFDRVLEDYGLKADGSNVGMRQDDVISSLGFGRRNNPADNAVAANGIQVDATRFPQLNPTPPTSKITSVLQGTNKSFLRMEEIMKIASGPDQLTPQDLLLLQAGLSKEVLMVEMASKGMNVTVQAVNSIVNRGAQ